MWAPLRSFSALAITNENTEAVKKIVMENRRITIREVAEDAGISVGSCHAIFADILGLKRLAAKFVPKLQKQHGNHASATVFTRFSPL